MFFAVFLTGTAQADTLHTSFNFILGTGSFYNDNGLFAECTGFASSCTASGAQSTAGSYNLFNSSLGTLNGVTVTLTSIFPLGTEPMNFGGTGTVSGSSDYNVGGIFTGTIAAQGYTCSGFCDDYPVNGTIDNALNASYTVPLASLATYLGTGTANMTIAQSVVVNGSSSDSYLVRARSNQLFTQGWRGTVDVAYDFTPAATPVPEPSSAKLMLGGVSTLAGFVRRKMRR
jgi:hypothetical protein